MTFIPRPDIALLRPAYVPYIMEFKEDNALDLLREQGSSLKEAWKQINADKRLFAYAEGKWNVQQLIQHVVDTERIFAYRALSFARGEALELPAFTQNDYAAKDDTLSRPWETVLEEWDAVRSSTLALYAGMSEESLNRVGVAGGGKLSPASIAWLLAGHAAHHQKILKERYLV